MINNKKQKERINNNKIQQKTINCKEIINGEDIINNKEIINDEEPLDEELLMISNIWNNSNTNNKNSLIRDILDKSIISDIMDDESRDD